MENKGFDQSQRKIISFLSQYSEKHDSAKGIILVTVFIVKILDMHASIYDNAIKIFIWHIRYGPVWELPVRFFMNFIQSTVFMHIIVVSSKVYR